MRPRVLRRAAHVRNTRSADICSLRYACAIQSDHPRLGLLSIARMDECSKFTLGHPLRWARPDDGALPGGGSAQAGVLFPAMLRQNRPSDAPSQRRAHLAFDDQMSLVAAEIASTRAHVKRLELSRSKAPSIVQGTSTGRGPLPDHVPVSRNRSDARHVFAPHALPETNLVLAMIRYPPVFLLCSSGSEGSASPADFCSTTDSRTQSASNQSSSD